MVQEKKASILQVLAVFLQNYGYYKDDLEGSDVWDIDLSNPDLQESTYLLNLYFACSFALNQLEQEPEYKYLIDSFLGKEALAIIENLQKRLHIILPELTNIINGTASEEDFEELIWQNKFANSKKALIELANQAKQTEELIILDC